jgi:hypothetical protein
VLVTSRLFRAWPPEKNTVWIVWSLGVEEPACAAAAADPGRDKLERVYDEIERLEGRVGSGSAGEREMPG